MRLGLWQEPDGKRDARAFHNLPQSAVGCCHVAGSTLSPRRNIAAAID